MKSEMFFTKDISRDPPPTYEGNKKVVFVRGIKDKDELYNYLCEQNKMISGNYTLLPQQEISRFLRLGAYSVLMRSSNNNSLIGCIISLPLPIRCSVVAGLIDNELYTKNKIINHGCTSFLNIHSKLRGHGLCIGLIRELTKHGHENSIYCGYSLTSFPLSVNSFEVSSWYRPLDLARSIGLGFPVPHWNEVSKINSIRMNYKTNMPKKYLCKKVKNAKKALDFYKTINEDKKFVFMPDINLFEKWIQEYATFLVSYEKEIVGIFSIGTVICRMESGIEGKLCLPLFFNSKSEHASKVFKCCIFEAGEKDYDVIYTHSFGDLTKKVLEDNFALETPKKSFFTLYNNKLSLTPEDLYVPLF